MLICRRPKLFNALEQSASRIFEMPNSARQIDTVIAFYIPFVSEIQRNGVNYVEIAFGNPTPPYFETVVKLIDVIELLGAIGAFTP